MVEGKKQKNIGTLTINGQEYDIFIAKTDSQKERGFQGFKQLPKDEGMLFVNDDPEDVWYHMKNVGMDLDLVFMDDDFKVISVKHGKANDPTPIRERQVSYVLEVNAGSGIKEGDEAELDDEDSHKYVMKILDPQGNTQMELESGERIVSRRETLILIRKALKARETDADKDYKALGRYMFKVLKGQDGRKPEYVPGVEKKEDE